MNDPTLAKDEEVECVDGDDHEWQKVSESYGEDRDGNRGTWYYFDRCTKCGAERR